VGGKKSSLHKDGMAASKHCADLQDGNIQAKTMTTRIMISSQFNKYKKIITINYGNIVSKINYVQI